MKTSDKEDREMKLELLSASNFLVHLLRFSRRKVTESQLSKFRDSLLEVLRRRYRDHWFPDKPFKGSGYRCIRINGKMDPVINQAGESCGLKTDFLHTTFPTELTMWIDPKEVSYRIGENGSICVLYEYREGLNEPWKPSTNLNQKPAPPPTIAPLSSTNNKTIEGAPSCKTTMMNMEYLHDPRKSVSIEALAAYVSS